MDNGISKTVSYIVFPNNTRSGEPDLTEGISISTQRKAIEIKAREMGWNIVGEFALPKKANRVDSSEFRELVEYVERHNVSNVAIFRQRIHRDPVKSALIEATLMRVGARVMSIHDTEDIPAQLRGILRMFSSYDTLARREAQLHGARKRRSAAA